MGKDLLDPGAQRIQFQGVSEEDLAAIARFACRYGHELHIRPDADAPVAATAEAPALSDRPW